MPSSRIALLSLLTIAVITGLYGLHLRNSKLVLTVQKQGDTNGGAYQISGRGFAANETVSLEIKNAPLSSPSGWHLGTTKATKGQFSFQTEDFRCVHVDDPKLREQYQQQHVIFVATGLSSGRAASVVDSAGTILVCR